MLIPVIGGFIAPKKVRAKEEAALVRAICDIARRDGE